MILRELIKRLQQLEAEGHGGKPVATGASSEVQANVKNNIVYIGSYGFVTPTIKLKED